MMIETIDATELNDTELEAVLGALTTKQMICIAIVAAGPVAWMGFGIGMAVQGAGGLFDRV